MNAERLLAHYERIADAPDAIARLRRFVLDLAVRGKLVGRRSVRSIAPECPRAMAPLELEIRRINRCDGAIAAYPVLDPPRHRR